MANDNSRRIVVVGGGVVGLTTAAALLRLGPDLAVSVLERDRIGSGASAWAGALDIPLFRSAFQRELVKASWAWHEARRKESASYRRPISITWYVEPGLDLASHNIQPLTPAEAQSWRPPEGWRLWQGPSFVIDPQAWCQELAREIEGAGRGEVVEHATVVALKPAGRGRVQAVCADGRCWVGDRIIIAMGPWLPGWNARARTWAASLGLRTKRVFGLNIAVSAGADVAAVGRPSADIFFHPAWDGSGYRLSLRHDEWDVSPDAEHRMVDEVLERAGHFLDGLLGAGRWSVTGHRVFVDSFTPERQAIIAHDGAFGDGISIVTGTHGSGIRLAPGLAQHIAGAVTAGLAGAEGAA
jgi:glycine/D-amino acid oxidase-like deaminating enzyme